MTTKITVSLPDEQVAALKAAVRSGKAKSVSALVSRTLAERQQEGTYDAFLARLTAAAAPTPEDEVWAERALDSALDRA